MSQDNQLIYAPWNVFGTFRCYLKDGFTNNWQYLDRVSDPNINSSSEHVTRRHLVNGRLRTCGRTVTQETAMLEMGFLAGRNPRIRHLLMRSRGDAQTLTTTGVSSFSMEQELMGTEKTPIQFRVGNRLELLAHTYSAASAAFSGAGGTGWSTVPNYFWYAPVYGTITPYRNTGSADTQWVNRDVKGYFTAGEAEATTPAFDTPAANEEFTFDITLTALQRDEPLPSAWIVFQSTTNTLSGAKVAAIIANTITRAGGTQTVSTGNSTSILRPANASSTAHGAGAINLSVRTIADYDTGTPTYVKLTEGTDYTYDRSNGLVYRIEGGGIDDGEKVEITQWWITPPRITTTYGGATLGSDYRTFLLIRVRPQEDPVSGEIVLVEGEQFQLDSVDVAGLANQFSGNEQEYAGPLRLSCEIVSNSSNAFGTITDYGVEYYNWRQDYGEYAA